MMAAAIWHRTAAWIPSRSILILPQTCTPTCTPTVSTPSGAAPIAVLSTTSHWPTPKTAAVYSVGPKAVPTAVRSTTGRQPVLMMEAVRFVVACSKVLAFFGQSTSTRSRMCTVVASSKSTAAWNPLRIISNRSPKLTTAAASYPTRAAWTRLL
jgi:hypothetical protein